MKNAHGKRWDESQPAQDDTGKNSVKVSIIELELTLQLKKGAVY